MSPGPLNLETLESLKEYADPEDPEFLRDLIRAYLADAEKRLPEIREAARKADHEGLRRLAHTFKGSSLNIGAEALAGLMQGLESEAKLGKPVDGDRLLRAEAEFHRAKAALSPYLA
jgi:HPt (histidine-containing phosphotransfer) domain-containing protein